MKAQKTGEKIDNQQQDTLTNYSTFTQALKVIVLKENVMPWKNIHQ